MHTNNFRKILEKKLDAVMDHAEANLVFVGLLGGIGFPLYFFVWSLWLPQPYENFSLRLMCGIFFMPWVFYKKISHRFAQYFSVYFLCSALFVMPFFFSFMTLKNEFSDVWSMSLMAGLFLLILVVYDWLLITLMSLIGFGSAYLLILLFDGSVSFKEFKIDYIPIYVFTLVGGLICNQRSRNAHETKITLVEKFSGSIAHEMRNPLGTIINAMDTFRSLLPQKSELESNLSSYSISRSGLIHLHQSIEQNTAVIQRGNKIIDAILTSMKNESLSTHDFLRGNTQDAIHTAIESFGYDNLDDKSLIRLKIVQNFDTFYDRDLFIHVLFNLIKNALHYKNKHDFYIEIAAAPGSDSDFNWIRVKDNGPGIPADKLEAIFDGFYTSGKKGGTGLGLSFCRRVIESFGGRIRCRSYQAPKHESQDNNWTEFLIKLPKYKSRHVQNIQKQILLEKRILVVDDQKLIRTMVKSYLSVYKCQVDEAVDGQDALDMMSKNMYDLVFMDIEMPIMRGDEAIELLRSGKGVRRSLTSHYRQAPIISVSSLSKAEHEERLLSIGVSAVLEKPIQPADIERIFEQYFFCKNTITTNQENAYERWAKRLQNKRILLVDDSQATRMFIPLFLQSTGCDIQQACNGQEAIDLMEKYDFDIVLMDMEMPVLGGIDTTRLIREGQVFTRFKHFRKIPIIALTGNTDKATIEAIKEAGMNDHLGKPATRNQLIEIMATWLSLDSSDIAQAPNLNTHPVTINHHASSPAAVPIYSWQQLDEVPIIDIEIINRLKTMGLPALKSFSSIFIDEIAGQIKELSQADLKKDAAEVSRIFHTIKGSAGMIGAQRMQYMADLINDCASKDELFSTPNWYARFENIYTSTKQELEQLYTT